MTHTDKVARYWNDVTGLYLDHMTTFQAGLFSSPQDVDSFHASNLRLAMRAGMRDGDRVLDAGCGVCGPSVDMALSMPNFRCNAVTNSVVQKEIAERRIKEMGLSDRMEVTLADFHSLALPNEYFDVVIFLESFGYTRRRRVLLKEINRVLRPGGTIYVKDVYRLDDLDPIQIKELAEFNRTYVYRTPALSEVSRDVSRSGFQIDSFGDITEQMDRRHSACSMFENPHERTRLTAFGKRHYRGFTNLPVKFFELKAFKVWLPN